MSIVTNVIILAALGPEGPDVEIERLNELLRNVSGRGQFQEVSEHAGGNKAMECRVYLGTFNLGDSEEIVRTIFSAPWDNPEQVQILTKEQGEDVFTLHSPE